MKTGRPRKDAPPPDTLGVSFRFPKALIEAIDLHVERMRARGDLLTYGVTRSDAARELIVLGLKAAEKAEGPLKRNRRRGS
jgi:hypothetical protein